MGNATKDENINVGIFDPYLDTLGGGERYVMTIAEYFSNMAKTDVFWHQKKLKEKVKEMLNINVNRVYFVPFEKKVLKRLILLHNYDLFFYVTDGSLFWSSAKQNILVIQSPAHIPTVRSFATRLKLKQWSAILCYSEFVSQFIEKKLHCQPTVLPPPVDTGAFREKRKENIILSTGRFFSNLHSKKQDFLVDVFIKLYQQKVVKGWQLVLIGSVFGRSALFYLNKIRQRATNYPIKIVTNAPFSVLKDYYAKAKIFWLATGYGEDLQKNPEKAEHFGIVTIEAMAAGCAPIVFNGGGQPEIVDHGKTGYLFRTEDDLVRLTTELIDDEVERNRIGKEAKRRSQDFSKEVFVRRLSELFSR